MTIAEIIHETQPEIYCILISMAENIYLVGISPPDEDEHPAFRRLKRLMEERKGVVM